MAGETRAAPTTVYITPRQRKRLFERARKRKTSFSDELRSALDLYLDLPADFDEQEFAALAREAKASLDRSAARLDGLIAMVSDTRKQLRQTNRRLDELGRKRV